LGWIRRKRGWNVEARCSNPVVGHPIVDVEAIWGSEIVTPIDAGREHDMGDSAVAFFR